MPDANALAQQDFFISYTGADLAWAEWIGWELEAAGYTVALQAWDFAAGTDFVGQMDCATRQTKRTLVVLSPRYLAARYTQAEWHAAFRRDPTGELGLLLPVRIEDCGPTFGGLLANLAWLDLVGLKEGPAREHLLAGVRLERGKPLQAPAFPGGAPHTLPMPQQYPTTRPTHWRVPFDRNPLFTGREEVLAAMEQALLSSGQTALTQALTGLGGIGKTQTALEYAYRYQHRYQAVLWVQAETPKLLTSEFAALAGVLGLPEAQAAEQDLAVAAVQRWLVTHGDWLLVLDNVEADDLEQVRAFLPARRNGHVLLTTRTQAVRGLAQPMPLALPPEEEACRFLLRRAGLATTVSAETDKAQAHQAEVQALVEALGALPLALDQAGAYIEATGCGLVGYRALLQTHQARLLNQRGQHMSHPEPVAHTWELAFQQLQQTHPAAVALLRLCAYLAPEGIPEDLFTAGRGGLPPVLQRAVRDQLSWQTVLEALRRYSLVEQQAERREFSVHRLVLAVVRAGMPRAEQRAWAERAVRLVNGAFPDVEFAAWARCQKLLPHALFSADHIAVLDLALQEAARLLHQAGHYLYERGQYAVAELLYQQARGIFEQVFGPDHPDLAANLNNLAALYRIQRRLGEAESLWKRALAIREQALGPDHPDVASSLNNLALLYQDQGEYAAALPLYQRSQAIFEQALGSNHPDVAHCLNNLAGLYRDQGRLGEAEPLYQRALAIREEALGSNHPEVAISLNNLALLYFSQGRLGEAESLWKRALAIREQALGPNHPQVATCLSNLAHLYYAQRRLTEAESHLQWALVILEKALGPDHPNTRTCRENLAALWRALGRSDEAETLEERAQARRSKRTPPS